MQNRYAGDVGDFGKLGLLRFLENQGLKIGVNWYLTDDESHNDDGKFVQYTTKKEYAECDDELLYALSDIVNSNNRSIDALENKKLLTTSLYYSEKIQCPSRQIKEARATWHQKALSRLAGSDMVFLDPDNGLITKSKSKGSAKSIKYVFPEEIIDYYKQGNSVVFYNHRTHEKENAYLERFHSLFQSDELKTAEKKILTFCRYSLRDYIFIIQPEHSAIVNNAIRHFLETNWQRHFKCIHSKFKGC